MRVHSTSTDFAESGCKVVHVQGWNILLHPGCATKLKPLCVCVCCAVEEYQLSICAVLNVWRVTYCTSTSNMICRLSMKLYSTHSFCFMQTVASPRSGYS